MLNFDNKIRTRISFRHFIEFGQILYSRRSLYSMSFFEDNKIIEVNFQNKTRENWTFSENNFIQSYQKFSLQKNSPLLSVNFKIEKEHENGDIQFNCDVIGGDWNTGYLKLVNPNLLEMTFSRVSSYLGRETNCYFGQNFLFKNDILTETQTIKTNIKLGTTEVILSLTHEYQFKETLIEKVTENILKFGWNDFEVNQLVKNYNNPK